MVPKFLHRKEKKKGSSKRGKAFHPEEDKVICSTWLNVSKDPIVGTNQPAKGSMLGFITITLRTMMLTERGPKIPSN